MHVCRLNYISERPVYRGIAARTNNCREESWLGSLRSGGADTSPQVGTPFLGQGWVAAPFRLKPCKKQHAAPSSALTSLLALFSPPVLSTTSTANQVAFTMATSGILNSVVKLLLKLY